MALALVSGLLLGAVTPAAQAQSMPGLYACKDSRGRSLSSDRPIAECADRQQLALRQSCGVLRTVGPSYSELDQAAREHQLQQADRAAAQRAGERRRERALLARYPNSRLHDQERADALAQLDQATHLARNYLAALNRERRQLDEELQFFRGDRAKAPAVLSRKFDENEENVRAQTRFIQSREEDQQRLAQRFASERAQLEPLWRASSASR
ncbi:DUF4124 domain-containing protein [Variovorax saccharolyticus]|uniref:DUF4124 domain-containing protein n=1 Tax=Variovorax saccharolyticus TaxID=3053516 RepID=UPI0025777F3F|nr:DUF4124 domain-containing protein [Variovorax sp. J22R187]MDM0022655.1 DUF4124 domain-containing protein [Variovorax sp. J22R187]